MLDTAEPITLEGARKLIARLNPVEKAELLAALQRDISVKTPGIESLPDVSGGSARIRNTRIPVWVLVGLRRDGVSDERIVSHFEPGLINQEDLLNAWAYAEAHPDEIDEEIRRNDEA